VKRARTVLCGGQPVRVVPTATVAKNWLRSHLRRPWRRFVQWGMAVRELVRHPGLTVLLVLCGTAGGLKYALFKAPIDPLHFHNSSTPEY